LQYTEGDASVGVLGVCYYLAEGRGNIIEKKRKLEKTENRKKWKNGKKLKPGKNPEKNRQTRKTPENPGKNTGNPGDNGKDGEPVENVQQKILKPTFSILKEPDLHLISFVFFLPCSINTSSLVLFTCSAPVMISFQSASVSFCWNEVS
jgi:hypothetical protein